MALAKGESEVRCGTGGLSLHTQYVPESGFSHMMVFIVYRTAIWIAEQLTDAKFQVEEEASGHTVIRCQGIGFNLTPPSATVDAVT